MRSEVTTRAPLALLDQSGHARKHNKSQEHEVDDATVEDEGVAAVGNKDIVGYRAFHPGYRVPLRRVRSKRMGWLVGGRAGGGGEGDG